jgi:putative ABC transport system permease protein
MAGGLVLAQTAIGLTLTVMSALTGRHIMKLSDTPPGLARDELITVEITVPTSRFRDADTAAADLAALRAIPGVAAAVAVDAEPLGLTTRYPDRLTTVDGSIMVGAWDIGGGEGIGGVLGVRLSRGRDIGPPTATGEVEAIVTRRIAARLFPGANPLGAEFISRSHGRARVVGVSDGFQVKLGKTPGENLSALYGRLAPTGARAYYTVRTSADAELTTAISARMREVDPDRIIRVAPADALRQRFRESDIASMGIVTAVIGAIVISVLIGTFALTAFLLQQRTRQIGLRRALGARRRDIIEHMLVENLLFTAGGVAVGVVGTRALGYLFAGMMPGFDFSWAYVGAGIALFTLTGLVATALPARRAASISPSAATKTL